MPEKTSPEQLDVLLKGRSQFSLIDVREGGEYNSSHIPGASLIPRKRLEFELETAVPYKGTHIVVCDDDGRRASLAAKTLERMGYVNVSFLQGGMNRWAAIGKPTEWGVNVPSKDFGEKVEVVHHVPEVQADELHSMIESGEKLVILDTRTPEEYQRFCIPGGRSVPNGELPLRINDLAKEAGDGGKVIINCAGRTRSIIGARVLQRMGLSNVYALRNGTAGWVLSGYELEYGANRLDLPLPSSDALAAAEGYAARVAEEDGVRFLDVHELRDMMARRDTEPIYFVDVRTEAEYEQGHILGFRWFPGGQAVQRSDEVAVVKNCPVVFACDHFVRATITASWFRQLGIEDVYAVKGGTSAWESSGETLEQGLNPPQPFGMNEAFSKVRTISPEDVKNAPDATLIFVDSSQDFANGHISGSRWIPRGWLEFEIDGVAPDKSKPVIVTCSNGISSTLAAATLLEIGYEDVSVMDGGMTAWREAALPIEKGLSGIMSPPNDMVLSGIDRSYAEMVHYLRWEEELGKKYERK